MGSVFQSVYILSKKNHIYGVELLLEMCAMGNKFRGFWRLWT